MTATTRAIRSRLPSVVGAGILAVLIWRLGTGPFLDGVGRIDTVTFLGAVGIGVFTTVCSAWRWCLVSRALGLPLPLGRAVADYYRALFLNATLPGGVLGDVHRAVRHGRGAGDLGRSVRAVVLERTAGQVALLAVGTAILLTLPSPALTATRHLAIAALALPIVVGALVAWAPRWCRALTTTLREARPSWPGVLVTSLATLAGHLALFLLAARAAGTTAPATVLLPLMILALLSMSLPLNIAGWGPREGVTAWSFATAGLGATQGLTVAVVYGVLSMAASLPGLAALMIPAGRQGSAPKGARGTARPATNDAHFSHRAGRARSAL
ncbi:lysylphosphatidylglycerol synthase transmembrane domain-containing protein [Streptomyces sp. NPDC058001]|uniref:lysylphosphatidylglycerol synthase transmembrane domain-containing protein n=1 Tax=Streptomyces sp. NPDC058001 TaxID=3346300 RepID=UPI0036E8A2B9